MLQALNPFKFGTIVEGKYFTDRVNVITEIKGIVDSANHLVLISPRRFGKSSLIAKTLKELSRPYVCVNFQSVTSTAELSGKILREIFKIRPFERLKRELLSFRIIPTITFNALNDSVEVSFSPKSDSSVVLEDVFLFADKIFDKKERLIMVFDEFQDVLEIEAGLDKKLRSIMQTLNNVCFVFLGSQESMMREIFEKKKSPFYHFGEVINLPKLPYDDFLKYLTNGFEGMTSFAREYSEKTLSFTRCHPYYGQQLAFHLWERIKSYGDSKSLFDDVVSGIVNQHELDYNRLWDTLPKTDKMVLLMLVSRSNPLKSDCIAGSTAFSSLKRLCKKGFLNKLPSGYEMEDPFFALWLGHSMT